MITMARCEVCGSEHDKSFTITSAGKQHTFDSFECAIHAIAPVCAHCARQSGLENVADRAA